MAFAHYKRRRAVRGAMYLVAHSPLAGPPSRAMITSSLRRGHAVAKAEADQTSLGAAGRWNRYRALPWPTFGLSATNPRRLGRTFAPRDIAPRSRRRACQATEMSS